MPVDLPLYGAEPPFGSPDWFTEGSDLLNLELLDDTLPGSAIGRGSHAYNASSSGDENGLFAPSDNSVRYDALMASGFDQNFAPTQQPFGSFFEFAQIPDSYSTATDGDAYGLHQYPAFIDNHFQAAGNNAPLVDSPATINPLLISNDTALFGHANAYARYSAQQQLRTPGTHVSVGISSTQEWPSQLDGPFDVNFDAVSGPQGLESSSESQREEGKSQQRSKSSRPDRREGITQLQDVIATAAIPHSDSPAPEPTNEQQSSGPEVGPRKRRSKRPVAPKKAPAEAEEAPGFPGPVYDFFVSDKDDVFLDPKLGGEFGKHDPHLSKKVSDAAKALKSQEGQHSQVPHIPGHQQVLWSPPVNDYSIPTKPEHYEICLNLLINAIGYAGEEVTEKRDTKEFKSRWIERKHYDTDFVEVLAKQVLDTLIEVHTHGWTYYVQDPWFRQMYHKTMYFTFRDRFNVTALVLKHSKTTCNDLMKGQRLYDIIGNSYHLETRVTSNKKANADRAMRLAKSKEQDASEKAASQKARTKRSRDADDDEESSLEDVAPEKPRKQRKVNGRTGHLSDSEVAGVQAHLSSKTAGRASTKTSRSKVPIARKASRLQRRTQIVALKGAILRDRSAWPLSAGVTLDDDARGPIAIEVTAKAFANVPPKRKGTKRGFAAMSEDEYGTDESDAVPFKKHKPSSRAIAPVKEPSAIPVTDSSPKASTRAPAKASGGPTRSKKSGSDVEVPHSRTGVIKKYASGSRPQRTCARLQKSAADTSTVSVSETASFDELTPPE